MTFRDPTSSEDFCQRRRERLNFWMSQLGAQMDHLESIGLYPSEKYSLLDRTYDVLYDFRDELDAWDGDD